jgi:hypothetical protein
VVIGYNTYVGHKCGCLLKIPLILYGGCFFPEIASAFQSLKVTIVSLVLQRMYHVRTSKVWQPSVLIPRIMQPENLYSIHPVSPLSVSCSVVFREAFLLHFGHLSSRDGPDLRQIICHVRISELRRMSGLPAVCQ